MGQLKDRLKNLFSQLKQLALRGFEIFKENNMSVFSGYAALFIVTSVFPFIILIISIVNLLPGYSADDVADILFQILPDLGAIKDLIVSLIENLQSQSGGLLASAAAVTTLWSASKGVMAIQKGFNQLDSEEQDSETELEENTEASVEENTAIEEIEKAATEEETAETEEKKETSGILEKGKGIVNSFAKPILKRLLFTLELVILIPALLVFEMLGDSIAGIICSAVVKVYPDVQESTLQHIDSFFHISSLVVIVFAFLVILQIFAVLPAKRRTLKSQIPGGILTGVCWVAFTELFAFFIPRFYHASSLYGSLASLFLLLLWLRYMVMILFAGGVLNRTLEEGRQNGGSEAES